MCFDRVKRIPKKPPKYAWKVFSYDQSKPDNYYGIYYNTERLYEPERWYEADYNILLKTYTTPPKIKTNTLWSRRYLSGFHVFEKEEDAQIYAEMVYTSHFVSFSHNCVKKVEIQDVRAAGKYGALFHGMKALTVGLMKIVKE